MSAAAIQEGFKSVQNASSDWYEVAHHLGMLERVFDNGEFDERNLSNFDDTHFMVTIFKCKTLLLRAMIMFNTLI